MESAKIPVSDVIKKNSVVELEESMNTAVDEVEGDHNYLLKVLKKTR